MDRLVGLFVYGFHAERCQFFANPPWHWTGQVADHRRLLIYRVWEHSNFIAVIQEPCVAFCSQQRGRAMTKREGMKTRIMRPMKDFPEVGIVWQAKHRTMAARNENCGVLCVVRNVV